MVKRGFRREDLYSYGETYKDADQQDPTKFRYWGLGWCRPCAKAERQRIDEGWVNLLLST